MVRGGIDNVVKANGDDNYEWLEDIRGGSSRSDFSRPRSLWEARMGDDCSDTRRIPRVSWSAPCDKQGRPVVAYLYAFIAWGVIGLMIWGLVKLSSDQ